MNNDLSIFLAEVGPEYARLMANTPYDRAHRKTAILDGMAECLADRGLAPSDVNRAMVRHAAQKTAANPLDASVKVTLAMALAAAMAGNYTGRMHHSIDRRLDGKADNNIRAKQQKLLALTAARDELADDVNSRPVAGMKPTSGSTPSPGSGKNNQLLQLID